MIYDDMNEWIAKRIRGFALSRGWPFQTALHYIVLCDVMTTPALITVPHLFGTQSEKLEWSVIWRNVDHCLYMMEATGTSSRNIDCVIVDGGMIQCKWVSNTASLGAAPIPGHPPNPSPSGSGCPA